MKIYITIVFVLFLALGYSFAQQNPPFLNKTSDPWVDSLMNKMSLDQKIGQLFMIQAYSNLKNPNMDDLIKLVNHFQVGGIIFMQGGPIAQAKISNKLQQLSNIPLLVAIDAETGLGFRLDSTLNYPVQMALGAITSDSLIYEMGYEIGKQCRLLGIHMNMAPVCDININPENPVINYRSFGEDKLQVARKSWLYASGMQDAGVLATAKHFPGHGGTLTDSHLGLPVNLRTKSQLDSLELFPFSYLINKGIGAVMTGHLQVPALDPNQKVPATLSAKIINNKLKKGLGFKGLVITDAMNMKGVSNLYTSAQSVVKALKAGNDMVEIVPRLDKAIAAVLLSVASGELSMEEIDEKCRKVLMVKKWLGLDKKKLVETKNLSQKLNEPAYLLTKRLLQEQSMTVLSNRKNLLPLQQLDTLKIASLAINADQIVPFQKMLGNYTPIDHFNVSKTPTGQEVDSILNQLKPYNLIIIGIHGMGLYPFRRFGITDQEIGLIERLQNRNTIVCFFGNPYALQYFPALSSSQSLIVAYQDDKDAQEMAAQLIFGATNANAKLPVNVKDFYPIQSGLDIKGIQRLKYTLPEEVKINSQYLLHRIDSIAEYGIESKAYPGCQVLIAKEGKVILNKSYGYFTYEKEQAVQNGDLYDLASVTKISAPLPAIMKLYDEKQIYLDVPFSNYFAEFKKTNKADMTLREILIHQARLQSGLPFWLEPGKRGELRNGVFKTHPEEQFQVRIAKDLYEKNDFKNQIIKDIVKSPLLPKKEYLYSDLGFSLFPFMIERITGKPFQEYLNREFYKPLGTVTTGFNPYERFPLDQIAPTERDLTFRKELAQGFVHDELAALLGGVSGNAGLFSSANDLAKVMQMYLQEGYYGGKQYISSATMQEFTKAQSSEIGNRRALGFDRPNPGIKGIRNTFPAADASPSSYGHTGFTGIFTWMDPEKQLLFIFLSNRVYPTRDNSALSDLNIRPAMHQVIYDAIQKGLH
ncbi:MAG TPA: glycoside hydrolase family 3 N-terminal domain-containing protein [Prolixibacteraceae bacterium]|jgi:beta-glucosidase-like glycosyl hydrolase/CubicO group peptidase (beta-lactamase class C family)